MKIYVGNLSYETTKEELNKDRAYRDFRTQLTRLRKEAESISSRLTKHIEKYVSTVDI